MLHQQRNTHTLHKETARILAKWSAFTALIASLSLPGIHERRKGPVLHCTITVRVRLECKRYAATPSRTFGRYADDCTWPACPGKKLPGERISRAKAPLNETNFSWSGTLIEAKHIQRSGTIRQMLNHQHKLGASVLLPAFVQRCSRTRTTRICWWSEETSCSPSEPARCGSTEAAETVELLTAQLGRGGGPLPFHGAETD